MANLKNKKTKNQKLGLDSYYVKKNKGWGVFLIPLLVIQNLSIDDTIKLIDDGKQIFQSNVFPDASVASTDVSGEESTNYLTDLMRIGELLSLVDYRITQLEDRKDIHDKLIKSKSVLKSMEFHEFHVNFRKTLKSMERP